jgi:hypothetical protein
MHGWQRTDLWAEDDARNLRRAAVWKATIALAILAAWIFLTTLDAVSYLELMHPLPP